MDRQKNGLLVHWDLGVLPKQEDHNSVCFLYPRPLKMQAVVYFIACTACAAVLTVDAFNVSRKLQDVQSCIQALQVNLEARPIEMRTCNIEKVFAVVERVATRFVACEDLEPEDILSEMLGAADNSFEALDSALQAVCVPAKAAFDAAKIKDFQSMNGSPDSWFKNFYDGGTELNQQVDNDSGAISLMKDASFVKSFFESTVETGPITFPDHLDNFANCEAESGVRAVMCCWVQDRQEDDDGDCASDPYSENCRDADPDANTNLCYIDQSGAKGSNHVVGGLTFLPGLSEGETHCHGLAWTENDSDDITRYRGNNLFFISMYDHLYTRGYVRQAPGAAMCGCMNQLPVATRSDCTQVDVIETFRLTYDSSSGFSAEITEANVRFNACRVPGGPNNNLEAYYKYLNEDNPNDAAKIEDYLVGRQGCEAASAAKLAEFGISS